MLLSNFKPMIVFIVYLAAADKYTNQSSVSVLCELDCKFDLPQA